MRFECEQGGIRIIPETPQDQSFLRHDLGLVHNGDTVELVAFVIEIPPDHLHIVDVTAGVELHRRDKRKEELSHARFQAWLKEIQRERERRRHRKNSE